VAPYGTEGTLVLPDPNFHYGPVRIRQQGDRSWRTLPQEPPTLDVTGRGMGALEAAHSLTTGRPMLATATTALHILKVMSAVRESAAQTTLQTVADAV
jgi:predicted dehydrogenase